jgi:hypothetical protein
MADRAVLGPPGRAARGLTQWAVDLWPYVNGKSLTLGLRLAEMELSDMVDVLHYLFEEDSRFGTAEEAEALSSLRTALYSTMYNITYRYPVKSSGSRSKSSNEFSPSTEELKPYIPPTEFDPDSHNPFGSVLDAPIG